MSDNHWSYTRSPSCWTREGSNRCSSVHTASGRTGKWNDSTRPCKPNGPTGSPSEAIKNTLKRSPLGSTTRTMNATTPPAETNPSSTDCHQPDGRVQLDGFDPGADGLDRLHAGGELMAVVELGLRAGPEALLLGIVPAHPRFVGAKAGPPVPRQRRPAGSRCTGIRGLCGR